jgi:hypothetical protein
MPASAVDTVADPDEFAGLIRGGSVELTVTGHRRFNTNLTRLDLHRPRMQRFADNLPRLAQVDLSLRDGAVGRNIKGTTYFVFGGAYYRQFYSGSTVIHNVVAKPAWTGGHCCVATRLSKLGAGG